VETGYVATDPNNRQAGSVALEGRAVAEGRQPSASRCCVCGSGVQNLQLKLVLNRKGGSVATICGGAAVLALAVAGVGDLDTPLTGAMSPSSGVAPAPPSPRGQRRW
jgi:hypothetical protein